jgi:hypothetical protein
MASVRKTVAASTWAALTRDQQDLLARLCLVSLKGLPIVLLGTVTLRAADALLARQLVEYRDAIVRITETGVRVVVQESGLVRRRVG